MITRIKIDGFKSFHEFDVELQPFQVFIGPNGVGKSNLFDAIVLLSNLAGDNTLYEAFRKTRGEIGELFTFYPDGRQAETMSFAVEMLIPQTVVDSLGTEATVSSTRLRYELDIERRNERGFERLYVVHEQLTAITDDEDTWKTNIPTHNRRDWIIRPKGRRTPYISTAEDQAGQKYIYKHQDGRAGAKQETLVGKLERTILSTVNSAAYPTGYAVRQEMLNWRFLQLDPAELRTPSGIYSPTELQPDGSNLATVLYRILQEDQFAFNDISLDMASLVPGILEIFVEPIVEREEFVISAETRNGNRFSSRVLSDGTLRLLALVTLKNDPTHRGVLCFEEPENGVHPLRLEQIVDILMALSTDFRQGPENEVPKQVLVNTHSPRLIPYVPDNSLLFVDMRTYPQGAKTWMVPVKRSLVEDEQQDYYTWNQIERFLDPSSQQTKLETLERSGSRL